MNTEPLFRVFDDLTDCSEKIPLLRKVIFAYLLHSAVNSPSALTDAAEIRKCHEVLGADAYAKPTRRSAKANSSLSEEDLPSGLADIPSGMFERLGNIASVEKGLSKIQSTTPGDYPLVVTADGRSTSDTYSFEGPAAIVPLVSSTGHGHASIKRLHYQEGQYAVGNILAVIQPFRPDLLHARFIFEYLTAFKEELLVSRMSGTANVSLTINKLKEVPIPIVSGPVLERIAELMGLCDRLEAEQAERQTRHAALSRAALARFADEPTVENLRFLFHESFDVSTAELRKTILTLAVAGNLLPQNSADSSVDTLVETLKHERSQLKKTASHTQRDVGNTNGTIPDNWRWVMLDDITYIGTGSTPAKTEPSYYENGTVPWITSAATNQPYIEKAEFHVTDKAVKACRLRVYPAGSLVIALYGQGKTRGQVGQLMFDSTTNQACANIQFTKTGSRIRDFVRLFFLKQYDELRERAAGGAQPNLSGGMIRQTYVPLPPLEEIERIVAKVNQLMALVDNLEQQLTESQSKAEQLMEAVVAELVSQN